jgi:hypothetical protein
MTDFDYNGQPVVPGTLGAVFGKDTGKPATPLPSVGP